RLQPQIDIADRHRICRDRSYATAQGRDHEQKKPQRTPSAQKSPGLRSSRAPRFFLSSWHGGANGNVRTVEIGPGAFHFAHYLTEPDQIALLNQCRALVDGPVPAYVPIVRGG